MGNCARFCLKNTILEVFSFLIPLLVAGFFFFHDLGMIRDFNHNPTNIWYFNFLMKQANQTGTPVISLINQVYAQWNAIPGMFYSPLAEFYVFGIPLTQVWFLTIGLFFGYTAKAIVLSGSIIGFIVVILTYLMLRWGLNRSAAFFGALSLAHSLMLITPLRMGHTQYGVAAFSSLGMLITFFIAHRYRKRRLLWLCAIFCAIGWFNGYAMVSVIMPISFGLFIILNKLVWKDFSFRIYEYIIALAVSLLVYAGLTALYSVYLNIDLLKTLYWINRWFFIRSESIFGPLSGWAGFISNLQRAFTMLFVRISDNPDNVAPFGQALLHPIVTLFGINGSIFLARKRTMFSRLILITVVTTIILFAGVFNADFRYIVVTIGAFYCLAGFGMQQFAEFFLEQERALVRIFGIMILAAGLAWSLTGSADYYFHTYAVTDGYLGPNYGRVQAGNYIKEHYDSADTLVVLNDRASTPEDVFSFSVLPEKFEYVFWENIRSNLPEFEDSVFAQGRKLVFLFSEGNDFLSMPGFRYAEPVSRDRFDVLHPQAMPVLTINSRRGWPVLSLFEISAAQWNSGMIRLEAANNYRSEITLPQAAQITAIQITGKVDNLEMLVNGQSFAIPVQMRPSMKLRLIPRQEGRLLFAPYYSAEAYLQDIETVQDIVVNKDDTRYVLLSKEGLGEIVYGIKSSVNINSLKIKTHPRWFNDPGRKNRIFLKYSSDGREFQKIYSLGSDGSGSWTSHFNQDTFHEIRPQAKDLKLRFGFVGREKEVELWSPFPVEPLGLHHVMQFSASLDTVAWGYPELTPGKNIAELSGDLSGNFGTLEIFYRFK